MNYWGTKFKMILGGVNNWNKRSVATYPSHPPEKKDFCRPFLFNSDFLMLCRPRAADVARARPLLAVV